ncbi:MAG: GntR family transcriptional regulator [Noviherbaspirillum sp.]
MSQLRIPAAPKRLRKAVLPELVAQIHQYLREQKLAPGTHVTAQELTRRFGVSRWTVSKAFERLAEKGVMNHRKESGYYVSDSAAPCVPDEGGVAQRELGAVYFRLADDRLSGKLPEQVTEAYLRQRYELTAAELSILLHRIAKEGWIERRAGYGWTFPAILDTPEALEQVYRLRLAIEPAALLEPKFHMPAAVIARLRQLNEEIITGAAETLAPDALYDRGLAFHEAIAEASQNPFFLDAIRRINSVRRLLIYRSMGRRERFYGQSSGHLLILDLIERGDLAAASLALRRHLEDAILKVSPDVTAPPLP